MNNSNVWRWTGVFGLAAVALGLAQYPLYSAGSPPSVYGGAAFGQHLFTIQNVVFTRILADMGLSVAFMVFGADLSHLIRRARPEYDWAATLVFGALIVWVAVTLVANGLEGAAAIDTLGGRADPSAVRGLIEGTLPIYNGAIAFVITGLFLGAAGYAIFATGVLPRWTGWVAYIGAALCALFVPTLYGGPVDYSRFYNIGRLVPAIIANVPCAIWFLVASLVMIRKR
jgi:hypothetical protein